MRSLLTNNKLIYLLDEIESKLGPIHIGEMSREHSEIARCSMSWYPEKGWHLLVPRNIPPSQSTICHELAHLVLLIEGWPIFIINNLIQHRTPEYETFSMLTNLILHIDVWDIVKKMGYDELQDYRPGLESLINDIDNKSIFNLTHPDLMTSFRAAYIAQALLGPKDDELIIKLEYTSIKSMPTEFELAQDIVDIFQKYVPLNPEKCLDCFSEVLRKLNLNTELFKAITNPVLERDFRLKFLSQ